MKVLLADDHKMMRDGLRAVLERDGVEIVGEAQNGREAVALARQLRPDVLVMDIGMPGLNGIDATRLLSAELPKTKVVGLSMHVDRRYVIAMLEAGAVGYLVKNAASEELLQALAAVRRGEKYLSPAVAGCVMEQAVHGPAKRPPGGRILSGREREVLQLVAEGCSSKDIATRLGIAVPTVETHRRQIMEKLGLRGIAELTKYAIREGLTSLED
jgi:DNA-binding NarL/FixJ family response regulator